MFDIQTTWFTVLGYAMSPIEFSATLAGLAAVLLSIRASPWNWPLSLIGISLFGIICYQVQLYPDLFLQAFYFIASLIGWYTWLNPSKEEENQKEELKITHASPRSLLLIGSIGSIGAVLFGLCAQKLHVWFPVLFALPSAFPFMDSFILTFSILATFLMIRKKMEFWLILLAVDILGVYVYYIKGIKFISLQMLIYCGLAIWGYLRWRTEWRAERAID